MPIPRTHWAYEGCGMMIAISRRIEFTATNLTGYCRRQHSGGWIVDYTDDEIVEKELAFTPGQRWYVWYFGEHREYENGEL
jgi:hypothetical protein